MKAETPATFHLEPCGYLLIQIQQLEMLEHGVRYFQSE